MTLKKIQLGWYAKFIMGKEYWIQSPQRTETRDWVVFDMTRKVGYKAETPLHFPTLRDARAHLANCKTKKQATLTKQAFKQAK